MKKKILIFGGTGAIGFSLAKNLQSLGYNPIIIARNEEDLIKKSKEIVCSYEICDVLKTFSIESILTRKTHKSGTDRVSEVFNNIHDDFDIIINLQGDLPIFKDELVIKTINIPGEENSLSAKDLKDKLLSLHSDVSEENSIEASIKSIAISNPDSRILICGSLYLAGQVLKLN